MKRLKKSYLRLFFIRNIWDYLDYKIAPFFIKLNIFLQQTTNSEKKLRKSNNVDVHLLNKIKIATVPVNDISNISAR